MLNNKNETSMRKFSHICELLKSCELHEFPLKNLNYKRMKDYGI